MTPAPTPSRSRLGRRARKTSYHGLSTVINFTGTWQADLSKSKLDGPPPDRLLITIEHHDPQLLQTVLTTTAGRDDHLTFSFTTDGEDTAITLRGNPGKTRAHWRDAELVIESSLLLAGRELQFRDYWSLSADGRLLTMEHRDDALAGQVTFLERTPGVV
jgi:hypothetical protein